METTGASLPEFEFCWHDAISAPIRRAGDVSVGMLIEKLLAFLFEKFARGDGGALDRCGRANARGGRAVFEIAIGFFGRRARNRAFDTDLALEFGPVEN